MTVSDQPQLQRGTNDFNNWVSTTNLPRAYGMPRAMGVNRALMHSAVSSSELNDVGGATSKTIPM